MNARFLPFTYIPTISFVISSIGKKQSLSMNGLGIGWVRWTELEENKSCLIEFRRYTEINRKRRGFGKTETFTLLGFTHYCSRSARGWFRVKRKTSKKKIAKRCKEVNQLISSIRHWSLELLTGKLNRILVGCYHYHGITDNFITIQAFKYRV